MEIVVSLSALPPSLYRKYVKGWKPNPVLLKLFEQISGKRGRKAMRIYIDAKTDNVIKNITDNVKPPKIVVDELATKGVEIVDYVAGTGKDKHGRVIRLGRSLKSAEAKKAFDSDPQRKSLVNATRNHQLICISMHPYDIAGMSTDRGWTSCMDLVEGSNRKYVGNDINQGTLIAYLIDANDKNINKPVARCLAKPYYERTPGVKSKSLKLGGKTNAMYLVEFAYPDSTMPFVHVLQEWFDEHINPKIAATARKGVYELAPKLYADKRESEYVYDLESPLAKGDLKTFVNLLVNHGEELLENSNVNQFNVVENASKRYPQVLALLAEAGWKSNRWASFASDLIQREEFTAFQNMCRALIKRNGVESRTTLALWDKASRTVEGLAKFMAVLPEDGRDTFIEKNFLEIVPYAHSRDAEHAGGYPNALAQIWSLTKDMTNAEENFWRAASRINNDAVSTGSVEEEYDSTSEFLTEVIAPAIISLATRTGTNPASLDSLVRNKNVVPEAYYNYAQKVFAGSTPMMLDKLRGDDYLNLVKELAEETGARNFIVSYVLEDTKFSQYSLAALDDMFPEYDVINPRSDTPTVLVESEMSTQELGAQVFAAALAEYRKDVIPVIKEEMLEDDGFEAPGMDDDEEEWEDEWEDPEEDEDEEEEDFDLRAKPETDINDYDEDDVGEFDDSWFGDDDFADNGAPIMDDDDEASEEAEYAQFLARQARQNQ